MSSASLVRDKKNNIKETGFRKIGKVMEYEFAFPYQNEELGDSVWQVGKAYQIAILVGPSEELQGVTDDSWMSDQVHIRLGSPSKESIYHPPYLVEDLKGEHHNQPQRGKNGQEAQKR